MDLMSMNPDMRRAEHSLRREGELLTCDGHQFKLLLAAGLAWLKTNHQAVNALNVFPIPDGDTGTNMLLTVQSAFKEIDTKEEPSAGKVAHAIAQGALMGARGNSGVILSQLFRGFARGIGDRTSFTAADFAKAMRDATDTAYRGVVKPVEGTILTVSKDAAAAAEGAAAHHNDLRIVLEKVVAACHESVARTPELLPVLKQAGVVDSGGKGLAILLEGMMRFVQGLPLDTAPDIEIKPLDLQAVGVAMEAVEPGQDWEVVVDFRPMTDLDLKTFYSDLEKIGTSIQVGAGDDIYRVHVHLPKEKRHEPIALAETLGTVVNVHMENLLAQVDDIQNKGKPKIEISDGQIVAVVVSPGAGFDKIFGNKAVALVNGGQTKNPSTADFLAAFEDLPTDKAIILPNNKNIQLAAQQAAEATVKKVKVLPTRTVPQGIAAMLSFHADGDFDEVAAAMESRIGEVETGEITTAVRSVEIDGVSCAEGQIIGLHNSKMVSAGDSPDGVVVDLLGKMGAADRELMTLYYGNGLTQDAAEKTAETVKEHYNHLEIEIHQGGQQHYHYIFSLE
jgi:DAK2 domain fusion protein YloV